jgi:hypothetical protein
MIPGPGHSKADRSLSVSIGDNGKLIWWSFAGDPDGVVRAYLQEFGLDVGDAGPRSVHPAARQRHRGSGDTGKLAALLWTEGRPIEGTLAAHYLAQRAIKAPLPPSLRFHPDCPDGPFRRPALIAARTMLAAPDHVQSVQRTFLARDGSGKARCGEAKKTLGACKGGGVALGDIGESLLVAEGVETALSASALFALPAVATLGTSFTRILSLPARVRRVLIAADNDEPGLRAAEALATRLRAEGRNVRIEAPPPAFKDFNDLATDKQRGASTPRSIRGGGPPDGV